MRLKEDILRAQSAEARTAEETMNTLKHGMRGHHIPAYIEEILTHNYCPYFVRMTMVREGDSYSFSYRPGNLKRLDLTSLDAYGKLLLLRSVMTINEVTRNYLIGAENYLIEPELIYSTGNSTLAKDLKVLFYPDIRRVGFPQKMMHFTERIRDEHRRDENELLTIFRDIMETDDINKGKMFLDKQILRIESRSLKKAG